MRIQVAAEYFFDDIEIGRFVRMEDIGQVIAQPNAAQGERQANHHRPGQCISPRKRFHDGQERTLEKAMQLG